MCFLSFALWPDRKRGEGLDECCEEEEEEEEEELIGIDQKGGKEFT